MAAAAFTTPFTRRLPEGWSEPEIVEDVIVADGLSLRRAGVAATGPAGEEVTGSAAEATASPIARSIYELLERVSTIEALRGQRTFALRTLDGNAQGIVPASSLIVESAAPDRWRAARSNAIALHSDWRSAALRAYWELVERDRILRAWYGRLVPERLAVDWSKTPLAETRSYDWTAASLPERDARDGDAHVVVVFGFPRHQGVPLVFGFGCRGSEAEALESAIREAMQILAFLWGEAIPDRLPALTPSAGYHLDYWQLPAHHDKLRRWIDEGHARYGEARAVDARFGIDDVAFVDLTPSFMDGGGLHVAKALCASAVPLLFGDAPLGAHLPVELRVHPIA